MWAPGRSWWKLDEWVFKGASKYLKANITACILPVSERALVCVLTCSCPTNPSSSSRRRRPSQRSENRSSTVGFLVCDGTEIHCNTLKSVVCIFWCSDLAEILGELSAHCSFTDLILVWVDFPFFLNLKIRLKPQKNSSTSVNNNNYSTNNKNTGDVI